ncbi:unnamed protein product [Pedinophyceae sp. YPF-701]|nr:unnamed protein product [Pedinophyceae sp. YPF-701]
MAVHVSALADDVPLAGLAAPTAALFALLADPAVADTVETVTYQAEKGNFVKVFGGVGYFCLVAFFFVRLFSKRAKFATSTRIASRSDPDFDPDSEASAPRDKPITGQQALVTAVFCLAVSAVLWQVSVRLDEFMTKQPSLISDQETVQQIAITIKTIVVGLAYLMTCIFGANGVGLFLMGGRMIFDPVFELEVNKPPESADVARRPAAPSGADDGCDGAVPSPTAEAAAAAAAAAADEARKQKAMGGVSSAWRPEGAEDARAPGIEEKKEGSGKGYINLTDRM